MTLAFTILACGIVLLLIAAPILVPFLEGRLARHEAWVERQLRLVHRATVFSSAPVGQAAARDASPFIAFVRLGKIQGQERDCD